MRLGAAWVWSGVTGCGRVRPGAGGCDWVRVEESFIRCLYFAILHASLELYYFLFNDTEIAESAWSRLK